MVTREELEPILRQHVLWHDPAAELAGVVRLVQRQMRLDPELPVGGIHVAVPNKRWMSAFKEALGAERITSFSPKQLSELRETGGLVTATIDFGGAVCVGSYGAVARIAPTHVFCTGLVQGMYPLGTEDAATLAAEGAVLRSVLADVPGTVLFSSFKRLEPNVAEALGVPYARKRREHGTEVVCVGASELVATLGDDAPPLVSGEQFLTTLFG